MVLFWSSSEDCWLDSCSEDDHHPTYIPQRKSSLIKMKTASHSDKAELRKKCRRKKVHRQQGQACPWEDGKMKPAQGYVGDSRRIQGVGCSWGQSFKSHRAQLYPEGTRVSSPRFQGPEGQEGRDSGPAGQRSGQRSGQRFKSTSSFLL